MISITQTLETFQGLGIGGTRVEFPCVLVVYRLGVLPTFLVDLLLCHQGLEFPFEFLELGLGLVKVA